MDYLNLIADASRSTFEKRLPFGADSAKQNFASMLKGQFNDLYEEAKEELVKVTRQEFEEDRDTENAALDTLMKTLTTFLDQLDKTEKKLDSIGLKNLVEGKQKKLWQKDKDTSQEIRRKTGKEAKKEEWIKKMIEKKKEKSIKEPNGIKKDENLVKDQILKLAKSKINSDSKGVKPISIKAVQEEHEKVGFLFTQGAETAKQNFASMLEAQFGGLYKEAKEELVKETGQEFEKDGVIGDTENAALDTLMKTLTTFLDQLDKTEKQLDSIGLKKIVDGKQEKLWQKHKDMSQEMRNKTGQEVKKEDWMKKMIEKEEEKSNKETNGIKKEENLVEDQILKLAKSKINSDSKGVKPISIKAVQEEDEKVDFLDTQDVLSPLSSPPSPLRLTLFPSPVSPVCPVLDSSLHSLMPASYFASVITTSKNWPVAVAHSAVAVGDQVYVFGGRQTNASSSYMSGKHVWRFKPSSGEWNYDTTVGVGSVPPNLNDASAVAAGSLVYVFGGWDGTGYQSSLRSYDTAEFLWRRFEPKGKLPSARAGACGWVEGGFLYFFGGETVVDKSSLPGGEMVGNKTNQVARFCTKTETWSNVETSGARPTPRCDAGLTKLCGKVYMMGGIDGNSRKLDDIRILDLKTFEWTELTPPGPSPGIRWRHSFTAVSPNLILLVGGWLPRLSSKPDVWTFDTDTHTWKHEQNLPEELSRHQAVLVEKKVYIVGGWKTAPTLSENILIFDFS